MIHVHHFPPGTSKWNKIEHRMFCHITQNWRGKPLIDHLTIVSLIGATTTKFDLRIECALDERTYEKGIEVSNAEMARLNITADDFPPNGTTGLNQRHRQIRSDYCAICPKQVRLRLR